MWQTKNVYWIPVKWHEITAAEKQEDPSLEKFDKMIDCEMPDDGQDILITLKSGNVIGDTCAVDWDGYFLESGLNWAEDVLAWAKYPDPYEER